MNAKISLTPFQFEVARLLAEREGMTIDEWIASLFEVHCTSVPHEVQCTRREQMIRREVSA